ncbi:hypothetical protein FSHL1_001135 [Fusarium sambucinum]
MRLSLTALQTSLETHVGCRPATPQARFENENERDTALTQIYPTSGHLVEEGLGIAQTVNAHWSPTSTCKSTNFSIRLKVKEYLKVNYQVKPSLENTIQPVFFNCVNCSCKEYEDSLSRLNPRQADLIADLADIQDLVRFKTAKAKRDSVPADIQYACLSQVFEDNRERVQQYLSRLYLGLGLASAPPGNGKSHLASIIVIIMCFNEFIKHVYITAASNGATDNINSGSGVSNGATDNISGSGAFLKL